MSEDIITKDQRRIDWVAVRELLRSSQPRDRIGLLGESVSGHYFARFGTAMLITPDQKPHPKIAHEAIAACLSDDSRVVEVGGEPASKQWSWYRKVFPIDGETDRNCLLSGNDIMVSLSFWDPMLFQIHVPVKNQPGVYDWDDVPTEDYWVAWDGATIFVLWECEAEEIDPPGGGGHVAFDVLREAVVKAGFDLMVQACSPGCSNMFGHTDVRIAQLPEEAGIGFKGIDEALAVVILSDGGGPKEALSRLADRLLLPGRQFAHMKNIARRLLTLESEARTLVSELLDADYSRLESQRQGWKQSLKDRHGNDYRRTAKHKIASLWLAMAGIETLRRDWNMSRIDFEEKAKGGFGIFYDIDRKEDEAEVNAITLDFIRAAVEQQSSRLDNRMAATVTAVGGIAAAFGGLAGALIGGLSGG